MGEMIVLTHQKEKKKKITNFATITKFKQIINIYLWDKYWQNLWFFCDTKISLFMVENGHW